MARANLANYTGEVGDTAGARDQYAALLPTQERVLGAEHPHTLITSIAGTAFKLTRPMRSHRPGTVRPEPCTRPLRRTHWAAKRVPSSDQQLQRRPRPALVQRS
jgi:hypothetical protein